MTDVKGLTAEEVEISRMTHGINRITQKKKKSFARQFIENLNDPIIKILLASLVMNIILTFRHNNWLETAGIAAAVFIATFVSTVSEYGADKAFTRLNETALTKTCRVVRAGNTCEIPVNDIVKGDIIFINSGETVPADGVVLEGCVTVDQSALNGESAERFKKAENSSETDFELGNGGQLFRGSLAVGGQCIMRASRVGDSTFFGSMAAEMQSESRESPLKHRLSELAATLSKIGYGAAVLVTLADLFNLIVLQGGYHSMSASAFAGQILHALTLGVTVVVVAVPEGLPMMITVVLSSNMLRMLKDNVVVRKLVGIETAGSLNILFTDKTGTLTVGNHAVTGIYCPDGNEYKRAADLKDKLRESLLLTAFFNTSSVNSTDRALMKFVKPLKFSCSGYNRTAYLPFNSTNKYSTATVNGSIYIKGAPEKLLHKCVNSNPYIYSKLNELTQKAVRVIAISEIPRASSEMSLVCLVGIRDELRREAKNAVTAINNAGIQIIMITGDNRETAVAVARECGIIKGTVNENAVLNGESLSKMSDESLKSIINDIRVISRAVPTDKSRLVRIAHESGLVTGMTGDGINDAPALKLADVGFAMGSGTDVAKEAGDIIIADNNIASIENAVLYGRTIFKSIRRFITFQLTMNLCACGLSVICPFIGVDTPITVIQMLWINIIMDTLAGLAFAGEAPLKSYMNEPSKKRDEPILTSEMLIQISVTGFFTIALCVSYLFISDNMTAFFALFIFCGVLNCFNVRTGRINLFAGLFKNQAFILIMLLISAVQTVIIYKGGSLFRTDGLEISELKNVILAAAAVIPADLTRKLITRKTRRYRRV